MKFEEKITLQRDQWPVRIQGCQLQGIGTQITSPASKPLLNFKHSFSLVTRVMTGIGIIDKPAKLYLQVENSVQLG